MRNRRILLLPLLALLAGLVVGFLQGGQAATASHTAQTSVIPIQSVDNGPTVSVLKSYPAIVAQPLPNAASANQLYILSDAGGAMCDVQPDPP